MPGQDSASAVAASVPADLRVDGHGGCPRRIQARKTPHAAGSSDSAVLRLRSDRDDVRGLRALGAVGHVERDLLTFGQALEARAGQRAEMHEHVLAAVILRDEAETLGIVEPL